MPERGEGSRSIAGFDGITRSLEILQQEQQQIDRNSEEGLRLLEIRNSWVRRPDDDKEKRKVVICGYTFSRNKFRWSLILCLVVVITVPIIVVKTLPKHDKEDHGPDKYGVALQTALKFFDAQMSGKLPKNSTVPWRRDSGLQDPIIGGYYDDGGLIKSTYPLAFSMTVLSWSAIEYQQKYENLGEYWHVRQIIKRGIDYLISTFDANATTISRIICQVGVASNSSTSPEYCWQRPEDVQLVPELLITTSGPDLAGEMAAALAAASILFINDTNYSAKLVHAAEVLFKFASAPGNHHSYSFPNPKIAYRSTGNCYLDELLWGNLWLYFATGNINYLHSATEAGDLKRSKVSKIFSWDNKLPGVQLLSTRIRMFRDPGYPFEKTLSTFHEFNDLNVCSFLRRFTVFKYTPGGMILLRSKGHGNLQYLVNAAFISSLYSDYVTATGISYWRCGEYGYIHVNELQRFAASQVDYLLGKNPRHISYLIGYGDAFPLRVHHRAASIPDDGKMYSCTEGWSFRDSSKPNPHNITGALVGGPDNNDNFQDDRNNKRYTEPSIAGNAGLVAALASLTTSGGRGVGASHRIFSKLGPLFPPSSPPPPPWNPN
ncbi:hypothetical protein MKX03_026538 [Papaver bracteatum]|nr:hypothetical protein MKX03_026538 [Papaver bracteatum]